MGAILNLHVAFFAEDLCGRPPRKSLYCSTMVDRVQLLFLFQTGLSEILQLYG